MFVNPQGVLKIYRNIPWHSDYDHVRQFNNKEERNTFLETNKKYGFENFSYIREQRALRVSINAENLYDCNYISFQNVGFGDRIFCAFITDIKYVNTETSEIYFVLDFYQTWWYDARLTECFVDREHVADDTIGLHTVDEGIYFGDYIARDYDHQIFDSWNIQIKFAPSYYVEEHRGDYTLEWSEKCGQFTIKTLDFEMINDQQLIDNILGQVEGEIELGNEIIAINLYPRIWKNTVNQQRSWDVEESYFPNDKHVPYSPNIGLPTNFVNKIRTLDEEAYEPSNGKLFTFPYCLLRVSNQTDTIRDLKWENINEYGSPSKYPRFRIRYNYANRIGCEIMPELYCGVIGYDVAVPLNDFPSIDFHATDHWGAFKSVITTLATTLGAVIGGATLGAAGAVAGGTVGSLLSNALGAEIGGNKNNSQTKLGGTNSNLALKYNTFGFWFYSMSIKKEYAEIIDRYFTRYGYKVNQIKRPELDSRERYNYVKTNGAIVENRENHSLPDEAETEIAKIFDKGVTVWHVNNIGTYGDNPII